MVDLYAVARRMNQGANEQAVHAIAATQLSLARLKLLHMLARPHTKPPTIARIAGLLEIDQSHATDVVTGLEKQHLVDRIPDEQDGRVRRVVITPRGRHVVDELDRAMLGRVESFARTLTADQRRTLARLVAELNQRPDINALRPADE